MVGRMLKCGIATAVSLALTVQFGQAQASSPRAQLADLLLWGADTTPSITGLTPALQSEVDRYRRRWAAYKRGLRPTQDSTMTMVRDNQVRYERRLVAIGRTPQARTLAAAYVKALRPCYEWEGFHDCPEREAQFADSYQGAHSAGPFREYLPLLAGHRWLCAAEGYQYEKSFTNVDRTRAEYERAIAVALKSPDQLVRASAEELKKRGTCFP